jgi:molybdopterin molybdotransferase
MTTPLAPPNSPRAATPNPNGGASKRPALRSLDDALAQLLEQARPLNTFESVSTFEADARVLAQDIVSQLNVPAFDNTSMDGYAIRSQDVANASAQAGISLPVSLRVAAGQVGEHLAPGCAARIFTGAPIPDGADAVIMQEDVEFSQATSNSDPNALFGFINIKNPVPKGQWIRPTADDVAKDQLIVQAGTRLNAATLGLIASLGVAQFKVAQKPRVALFSTGDELVMPGDCDPQELKPGAIFNSNRFFLKVLLEKAGAVVTDLGIVPDNREKTIQALQQAAQLHDLVLTSGGVSVGEEDHIKPAVQTLGQLDLWQISMKPGKPFAYGQIFREKTDEKVSACHFIGLPGNPVSSFVTFILLVRPFLLALQGAHNISSQYFQAVANFDWSKPDKRREFLRVRRTENGQLELFPNQSSAVLTSMVWANALLDNPGSQIINKGDVVRCLDLAGIF